MDARGITGRDLARETGISEGTIYNALGGRPILVRNAKLIAGALLRIDVEPALARLVLDRGRIGAR
jgi:transcriptional regulator with XRE-family HTH domain